MRAVGIVLVVVFGLFLALWAGVRIIKDIGFGIECEGHLKRAADANTIELAAKELGRAVSYLESEGMTSGYTSILYRTPDEDVGFLYVNLKASLEELKKISPDASQLEKSNVLMKLRETILDEGDSIGVTLPMGISVFPNNTAYAVWALFSLVIVVIGAIVAAVAGDGDY